MNIDRNNYEMYFLLYVDNELSAAQRNAVEKFIAENADLQTELQLLMKTALPSEDIVFTAKDILYKKELTPDSLQEQLLLQLDNELDTEAAGSLNAAIGGNNDLKREWNILQQTKLDPNEKFVFKHKKSLYRHESDRVIPIFFWRVAVAILIIGLVIFVGVSKLLNTSKTTDVAVENNRQLLREENKTKDKVNLPAENNTPRLNENIAADNTNTTIKKENLQQFKKDVAITQKENNTALPADNKNVLPSKQNIVPNNKIKDVEKAIVQNQQNGLISPDLENINNQDRNKKIAANVKDNINTLQDKNYGKPSADKAIAKAVMQDPGKTIIDTELTVTDNEYAKNAVINETESETNNNSILFINEEKVNRSRFSGLFRKVKRVLTRNANIKTGKNVKIAGFEMAAR